MSEYKSVMATDEEIKIFDKEQLEILLNNLKDIDKFTGFKDGAFKYELGKYQANILIAYIENLQQRIDKAIEYINTHITYDDSEDGLIVKPGDLLEILKGTNQ